MFIVKVECEGDTWYVHERAARINNRETALRLPYMQAKETAEYYRKFWKAVCTIEKA